MADLMMNFFLKSIDVPVVLAVQGSLVLSFLS